MRSLLCFLIIGILGFLSGCSSSPTISPPLPQSLEAVTYPVQTGISSSITVNDADLRYFESITPTGSTKKSYESEFNNGTSTVKTISINESDLGLSNQMNFTFDLTFSN